MNKLELCAGLSLMMMAASAQASDHASFWTSVQARCDATAATDASDLAQEIKKAAKTEHARWQGHRIDHTGRLYQFGLVESEQLESSKKDATLHDVGWWNVWRYWRYVETFDQENIDAGRIEVETLKRLRVTSADNALTATDVMGALQEQKKDTQALLSTIDRIDKIKKTIDGTETEALAPEIRQILKQSIVRSFNVDNAWSAAFISYVVGTTIKSHSPSLKFHPNAEHKSYIREAFEASTATTDAPNRAAYRACPIYKTKPRVGDMICYQREPNCIGVDPMAVANHFAHKDGLPQNNPPGEEGKDCKGISVTHCDIVTDIDLASKKLASIGGNVQQSVTERRLRLAPPTMVLSTNLGEADCRRDQPKDTAFTHNRCSLNNKDWFVLLQLRDGKPRTSTAR